MIRVTWRSQLWALRSLIPGTRPWRTYRDGLATLEAGLARINAVVAVPDCPVPPRDPDVLKYALGCMNAMVLTTEAALRPGARLADLRAVRSEHEPPTPRIEVP